MPWLDAVLDGERNYDLASTPLDWVDNMPIDRMRSMSIPQSWGVAICWMANYDSEDKEAIEGAIKDLRAAAEGGESEAIEKAMEALNEKAHKLAAKQTRMRNARMARDAKEYRVQRKKKVLDNHLLVVVKVL